METWNPTTVLTTLSVTVALFGVIVLFLTVLEYTQLRRLRHEFRDFQERWRSELQATQKALQRVIASYQVSDPDQRIALLESALRVDPHVFNGHNALGYAYLDKGDTARAIDAFKEAVHKHPEQVEGYCDLARAYLKSDREDLARKYLNQALNVDATATREGLRGDSELEKLLS